MSRAPAGSGNDAQLQTTRASNAEGAQQTRGAKRSEAEAKRSRSSVVPPPSGGGMRPGKPLSSHFQVILELLQIVNHPALVEMMLAKRRRLPHRPQGSPLLDSEGQIHRRMGHR